MTAPGLCVTVTGNEQDPNPQNNNSCVTTIVPGIPMIDPAVGSAATGLLTIGGYLYLRRRKTTGAAL